MSNDDDKKRGLPPEGLSLIIGSDDGVIDNADVRVRWCITPELTAYLEHMKLENPHIVISTFTKNGQNEWRGIFPINEIMSFARFYNAGEMNIAAFIIDVPKNIEEQRNIIRLWTVVDYDCYSVGIQTKGQVYKDITDSGICAVTTDLVNIPSGVFAKVPTPWLEWFANMWHGKQKSDDGCEFRRRAIIAFTIKWIPMALWTIIYWAFSMVVIAGFYGIGLQKWITSLQPLKNPFNVALGSIFDLTVDKYEDLRNSKYIIWIKWPHNITQPIYSLLLLSPTMVGIFFLLGILISSSTGILTLIDGHEFVAHVTLVLFTIIASYDICVTLGNIYKIYVSKKTYDISHSTMNTTGFILLLSTAAFLIISSLMPLWLFSIILLCVGVIGFSASDYAKQFSNKTTNYYFNMLDKIYAYFGPNEDYSEMRELLCPKDITNLSTNLKNLPPENISWILRYKNIKSKVCKPRQRR